MDAAELDELLRVFDKALSQIKWRLKPSSKSRLQTDILALCSRMRPCIMVDYGGKMPELGNNLCAFLEHCKKETSIFKLLHVLVVDDMVYLVEARALADFVKLSFETALFFVDIESDPPKMITRAEETPTMTQLLSAQKMFSSVFHADGISNDLLQRHETYDTGSSLDGDAVSESPVMVDLSCCLQETDVTIPTLNGWLLGYPVIYLFGKDHIERAVHNLSSKSLHIYQIFVTRSDSSKGQRKEELMSFTVPYDLSLEGSNEPWAKSFLADMKERWERCKHIWGSLHMEMSSRRIIIHYGGHWDRSTYVDGDFFASYVDPSTIDRANLVELIREGLSGRTDSEYVLWYITKIRGESAKVLLRGDMELLRWLADPKEDPEVYVIENGNPSAPEVNMRGSTSRINQENQFEEEEDEDYDEDEAVSTSEEEEDNHREELLESMKEEFFAWVGQPAQMDRLMGQRHFNSDHHSGSGVEDDGSQRNWMIPLPDFECPEPLGWVDCPPPIRGMLEIGSIFGTKEELRIALGMYHLEHFVECKTDRSADSRAVYICRSGRKNCTFRLCAKQLASLWIISKLTLEHTCQSDLNRASTARTVKGEVASYYFGKKLFDEKVKLRPREMMEEMRTRYGVDMLYCFAVRTRQLAIERVYGDFDHSYQRIPRYLYLLKQHNPGTVYDLETTSEGEFCHMFVALGQSIRAFELCLRPVIIVDATHLKGRNKGVLFVAVGKDGDEQVFPLAIGLGPIENNEEWTYFLYNLKRCYNPEGDLLIVSDAHKSIKHAVEIVYPNAFHGLCYRHLQQNYVTKGEVLDKLFKEAAYAYRHEDFDHMFSFLQTASPGIHRRLSEIGPERWARVKCPVRRYGVMTSNGAESLNSTLWWARRLPVCSLLESYRSLLERWFDERRAANESRDHVLTAVTFEKLNRYVQQSLVLPVRAITAHVYKVQGESGQYKVDLVRQTCDCRRWDEDLIPCKHAVAAIRVAGNGLNVYDFVHRYFKQEGLRQTYVEQINPVPHPEEWVVPPEVFSVVCTLPTAVIRQAGRPRMSRIRSAVEGSSGRRPQHCSRCGGSGHNRKRCTTHIPIGGVDLNIPLHETENEQPFTEGESEQPFHEAEGSQARQRRRRKKRCSKCHQEGHDRRSCEVHLRD